MCFSFPFYEGWTARGFQLDYQWPQCPLLHPQQLPRVPHLSVPTRMSQTLDLHLLACSLILHTAGWGPQLSIAPPRLPPSLKPAEWGTAHILLWHPLFFFGFSSASMELSSAHCGDHSSPVLEAWHSSSSSDQVEFSGRPQTYNVQATSPPRHDGGQLRVFSVDVSFPSPLLKGLPNF